MAIAFVGAASNTKLTSSSMELTPHASTANGHVMLAVISVRGPNLTENSITPPAGWTAVDFLFESGSPSLNVGAYVKVAAGEGSAYSWTFTSANESAGSILTYSGVDTAAPVDVHAIGGQAASSTTRTTPDIVLADADRWVVSYFADRSGSSWVGPDTERSEATVLPGPSATQVVSDSAAAVAAGTVNRTATASAATSVAVQGILALKPEAPPPPTPTITVPQVPVFLPGVPIGSVPDEFNAKIRDPFLGLLAAPAFIARRTGALAVTEAVRDTIEWDTIDEDPYAGWSAAAPGRWVVPAGWHGWWSVTAAVSLSGTGASGMILMPVLGVDPDPTFATGLITEGQEVFVPTGGGQAKTVSTAWWVYAGEGQAFELMLYYTAESSITAVDTTPGMECRVEIIWDGV